MAGTVPVAPAGTAGTSQAATTSRYTAPLAVLSTLFFMWGFLTCLNDFISPHLKALFDLNYYWAGFVQTAFFFAYFVMSLPSGWVVKRTGYKPGIIIGLTIAALGCLLFYPAAKAPSFPLFLVALFVLGAGITLLQVAANPFVAALGKPETASSRLTLTQFFNSLGTTIAPHFGAVVILAVAVKSSAELKQMTPAAVEAYRAAQAGAVQGPYLALAGTLVALAVAIGLSRLPKIDDGAEGALRAVGDDHRTSAWQYRHLVLGAVAIFVYVGAEVAIGSFMINYLSLPTIGGFSERDASHYVSLYWGGAMVGRFAGVLLMRRFEPRVLLALAAGIAAVLVAATMLGHGRVALWSVVAIGLFNSIMFPTIFTLGIAGLGSATDKAASLLIMAIVGGAIVPLAQGALADRLGVQPAFLLPLACYLFIVFYGWRGSRVEADEPSLSSPALARH